MKTIARHIINKFLKIIDKEKTLKTTGGKKTHYVHRNENHRFLTGHNGSWKIGTLLKY